VQLRLLQTDFPGDRASPFFQRVCLSSRAFASGNISLPLREQFGFRPPDVLALPLGRWRHTGPAPIQHIS